MASTRGRRTFQALNSHYIQALGADPTVNATGANQGTIGLGTNGVVGIWVKNDNGLTTNWSPLGSGGGVSPITGLYFVAKSGNDANNGSIAAPFLTVQKGIDAANASGVPSTVVVLPGTYNEAALVLKPFANLSGLAGMFFTTVINSAVPMTLSPLFAGVTTRYLNFTNISFNSAMNLDANAIAATNLRIYAQGCQFNQNFTFISGSGGTQINMYGCQTSGVNTITGGQNQISNTNIRVGSSVVFNTIASINGLPNLRLMGVRTNSNIVFNGDNVNPASMELTGISYDNPASQLIASGSASTISASVSGLPVQANMSLGVANLVYQNDAAGLGYTPLIPANYPVGTDSVQKALDAINSFGGGGSAITERENAVGGLTALQIGTGVPVLGQGFIMGFTADHDSVIANLEGAGLLTEGVDYVLNDVINPGFTTLIFDAGLIPFIVFGQGFQVQYSH